MVDRVHRSAALVAALVAVPAAVLAGVVAFAMLDGAAADPANRGTEASPRGTATGPVTTQERELTEREAVVCRALLSQLPGQVRDLPQRPVTAGAEQNAAYGDPPITVECGVPSADYAPTDRVYPLEGVCYHPTEEEGRSVWVTLDREVPIRVTVPEAYDGPGQWVAGLSDTVVSTILSSGDAPSPGCD